MDIFPFEIKRIIYNHSDLPAIKQLRIVSQSWAAAGIASLILPRFTIKSFDDILRLRAISGNPWIAQQAAKTVDTLVLHINGWDPTYFRHIVCNRHESRNHYQETHYVPTQAELPAFDELEEIIARMDIDKKQESRADHREVLKLAISVLSGVSSIRFECPNPFRHLILRKCWEEYDYQVITCPLSQGKYLFNILSVAKETGLNIRHLAHERLLALYFSANFPQQLVAEGLTANLESLSLNILDTYENFATAGESQSFKALLMASPKLRKLEISFEGFATVPVTIFPSFHFPCLESLSLVTFCKDGTSGPLLEFITLHVSSLRELQIISIRFEDGNTFRGFMERLRDDFGDTLERFQICGSILESDNQMMIFPYYNMDWTPYKKARSTIAKELEDFVLRNGPWPLPELTATMPPLIGP